MRISSFFGAAFLSIFTATSASATITVYTDPVAFANALGSSATENFDSLSPGVQAAPRNENTVPFQWTISSFDENWNPVVGNSFYSYQVNGSNALGALSSYNNTEFTFGSGNVNAFGGYFFGVNYLGEHSPTASLTFSINDNGDFIDDLVHTIQNPTATGFIGFITNQANFTWIDVKASFGDYTVFDNVTVGNTAGAPVPEPSIAGLIALGLGLSVVRRRRSA